MTTISIDIWSDVMCPFCYLGDTILADALAEFPHRDSVEVHYHSYQLMPELGDTPEDLQTLLEARYGKEQLEQQHEQLRMKGAELGIEFNFDKALAVNTQRAHELTHLAAAHGMGHDMVIRLFQAHFTDGLNVADIDTLASLAGDVGVNPKKAQAILESGRFADLVKQNIDTAKQMGVRGVPFFVFAGKYALSGAQPKEVFLQALETVWEEQA